MNTSKLLRIMLLALTAVIWACGGDSSDTPQDTTQWVSVDTVTTTSSVTTLSGTAWVSQGWVALHCSGLGCLFDDSTDNFPGVTVSCTNLTNGVTQTASSTYGGGTGWRHYWQTSVSVVSGKNVIKISALDPNGKGGSITLEVFN